MGDVLRKEVFLPHRREDVWVALTDRHALAEWLMPNDFEPAVGHKFRFEVDPMPGCSTITECEVLEVVPHERLVYSWYPVPKTAGKRRGVTTVIWTLTAQGSGTLLTLEHRGLKAAFPWWQRAMLRFGWGTMLKRWIPKILGNVHDGRFTPGVFPLSKRCYKAAHVPSDLTK